VTDGSGNHDATAAANQAASTTELRGGSTAAKIEFGVVAAIALVLAGHVFGGVPTADSRMDEGTLLVYPRAGFEGKTAVP
jgi:hypothetical protein